GVVFLDVTGMERHFADDGSGEWGVGSGSKNALENSDSVSHTPHPTPHSPTPELRLARAALRACDAISLPARVGIAASKLAARGIDPRPLMPRPLPPEFREGMELEWPLVALEPFLFIANAALDRLSKRMEIQGFACKRLEFTLTLDPEGYDARGIDLPAPTRDVKTMLTLMRLDLEKTPPGAPVAGFSFVAHPDRPR